MQIVLRKATWIQTFTLTQNTMNPLNQKYLETKISLKQIINFKKHNSQIASYQSKHKYRTKSQGHIPTIRKMKESDFKSNFHTKLRVLNTLIKQVFKKENYYYVQVKAQKIFDTRSKIKNSNIQG